MNFSIKRALLLILVLCVAFLNSPAGWTAEDKPSVETDAVKDQEKSGFNLGAAFVSIFRDHLSAVDGDRCPSVPTCSEYGVQAFIKHGFF